MARKLNAILADIDAGKKPEASQADLLVELSAVIDEVATGSKHDPKAGTFCSPDGELDFKYATVNDKLAIAKQLLNKALVEARQKMQEIVAISGADYSDEAMDEMITVEAKAIIVKNGKLRNLTVASTSSLF